MTKYKLQNRLTALILALLFTNTALAVELSNENKNNRTGNTISNDDSTGYANGNFSITVAPKANTSNSHQQQISNHARIIEQMKLRRRLLQEDQLEAYNRHMQLRKQQSSAVNALPSGAQLRRDEYLEQMNKRRELMNKMVDEQRKAAQQRKQTMLQKTHQTSTTSVTADET